MGRHHAPGYLRVWGREMGSNFGRIAGTGLQATFAVSLAVFPVAAAAYDILDISGPLYPVPNAAGGTGSAVAPYVSAPPPAAPVLGSAPAPWGFPILPVRLRVEGGAGYNNGGTDTTVSSPGIGSVSTNLFGGGGLAAEAGVWSDGMLMPNISLGGQFLPFDHSGSVTATTAAGTILGLTSA